MILDNDHFRNIEVTNGKLVNDGDHTVVAGVALPGLSDDLDLDREKLNLPEYVEITADAEDFTLSNTVTLASSSLFGSVDVDDTSGLDDLTDALSQLTDAMTQLMDGSSALYDGLNTLLDKSGDLISGIDQLAAGSAQLSAGTSSLKDGASTLASGASSLKDGASQLKSGLDTLTANNDTLNAGARQVFEFLLSMANTQLKSAGLSVETLTIENYGKVLDGVLASLDSDAVWKLAYNTASDQVTAAVYAKKDYIRSQVSQVVEGQVLAGVLQASGTGLTVEQYQTAVAAGQIPAETQAAITAAVSQQMASEAIQAQIDAATSQQIDQLIQQNLNSSEVQSQIDAAINKAAAGENSIAALKAQLDSYNQFYQGLKTYTAGVASADAGATQLDTGAAALKEGAGQLSDGASSLKEGADALNSGILALKDGSAALVDGVTQLRDGAMQLSDGLKEFNEKGVQKLTDAVSGDLGALTERIRAISDAAKAYQSYGGIAGGMELGDDAEVGRRTEGDDLAFALDDEPHGDALHAACGERRTHLLPEDGRELEADQTVEDAARLLGVDQIHVDRAGLLDGFEDGPLGDFVEDDTLGLVDGETQHFGQVPCDGFSFAVFIGRQPYGLALGQLGQFVHHFLLVARDFIDGPELVVDIDAQVFFRQVADVSETRLDDIVLAEELLDGFGLGGGLDDY